MSLELRLFDTEYQGWQNKTNCFGVFCIQKSKNKDRARLVLCKKVENVSSVLR